MSEPLGPARGIRWSAAQRHRKDAHAPVAIQEPRFLDRFVTSLLATAVASMAARLLSRRES